MGVMELSLSLLLYERCVMVELLPLDLSDVVVRPERTDSSDGLTLRRLSCRRLTPPVLCLGERRYTTLASSPFLVLRVELRSDPRVLGRELVGLSFDDSSMRLSFGKKRPKSLSAFGDSTFSLTIVLTACSCRRDLFFVRLLLGGESSTSIHSFVVLPCSLQAGLGPVLLLLVASVPGLTVFATSSAGLETISLGGTGGEARSVHPGYEKVPHVSRRCCVKYCIRPTETRL